MEAHVPYSYWFIYDTGPSTWKHTYPIALIYIWHRSINMEAHIPYSYWFIYGTGPSTWKHSYPIAEGTRQSPIDIDTHCAEYDATLPPLDINYVPEDEMGVANNGHSVMAQITNKSSKYIYLTVCFITCGLIQITIMHSNWYLPKIYLELVFFYITCRINFSYFLEMFSIVTCIPYSKTFHMTYHISIFKHFCYFRCWSIDLGPFRSIWIFGGVHVRPFR